ncbi:MAG: threonine--tRNA ligase [Bdellovibrionales bacterium RIFOXYB1_FULL_37_110]|nr:MAG: threonine--tRNA ligase [Bdellovibrionales bacterium RIFOXYA1_FULL_38_20]OFZ51521.1 MAG: threonine--tRNA ligase [Bdellovibrionales bacterium RIFOXYC1_FULL_37_79]OFZ60355.1 MAG: threonine--tRNA ligase [Bdellovibrionales bacterium RIFOXYB1_FULL_37_110]OFZ63845.1 MAG: threonine--tRNA ligase [Bdellovibrionales bacterium RIFOXYD1_FULL_36_51]
MHNYSIDTLRHSCAHVLAQAIFRLFPDKKIELGIGPTIENGFYYDIDMDYKLTEADLNNIEKEMKQIIKEKLPIVKKVLTKSEAIELFSKASQSLKVELIKELPDHEEISCYSQGEFTDLCRGPHVENTGEIPPFFKLLHTAGAYWKGDSNRKMLQRVYATGFLTKEELKEHLHFLEEAKKRDHRKLGKELELFMFDLSSPAMPFFTPKGAFIYNGLLNFIRRIYPYYGYDEVITPQILESELWHQSGHYEHYKENMYFTNIDDREYAVKPMNCPTHMILFKNTKRSYRDLPIRYADFGRIHRYEKSGTLAGLTRVRSFAQDDAHIFIALEGIQSEIKDLIKMFFSVYDHFGFTDVKIALSTRPEKKAGDDASWDKAEHALKEALNSFGVKYEINEGDGAFYGPKIDFQVADAIKRYHQLGTIQLDFQLPERFDLTFTNSNGESERPVVIHRALLGSIERFFGLYLEHVAGAYPFWLAPTQVNLIPVNNNDHLEYAKKLFHELKKMNMRVNLDDRNESMGFKTRHTQKSKIPFMAVIGDKEIQSGTVSLRKYGAQDSTTVSLDEMKKLFNDLNKEILPKNLRD